MKRKNVLLKFKDFLGRCNKEEKKELYDVLTVLRGPDNASDTSKIKRVFTCKIRDALGFHPVLTIRPRKDAKKLVVELDRAGFHWESHVVVALRHLESVELISTTYGKFLEKIRKTWAKQWEEKNDNRKTSQVSGKQ